jgi:hypothetical protein
LSRYAFHESCGTGRKDVGDVLAVGERFQVLSYSGRRSYGEQTALVEQRQCLSADETRSAADWRLTLGVIIFVVIVEILRIDLLAELRRQIEESVESVVFIVIFLKL